MGSVHFHRLRAIFNPMNIKGKLRYWFWTAYIYTYRFIAIKRISKNEKKLIVIFTPGHECRAGGVISIVEIYNESRRLRAVHGSSVILCAYPGDKRFLRYRWFKNDAVIFSWRSVTKRFLGLKSVTIHVPEMAINRIALALGSGAASWIAGIDKVHINVLLQHIGLFRTQNIELLKPYGTVTCTTAHKAYCTPDMRNALKVEMHHLSWWVNSDLYKRARYKEKDNLLIVSHDDHPDKDRILNRILSEFHGLKIVIVKDMLYEKYKELVHRARWSITFGEGLDNYFIEPALSGAIPFAVYNDDFFTPGFARLRTVYPSWEMLEESIVTDLRLLDSEAAHGALSDEIYDLVSELFSPGVFHNNLRQFYLANYTLR